MRIACPRPGLAPVAFVLLGTLAFVPASPAAETPDAKQPMTRAIYCVADLVLPARAAEGPGPVVKPADADPQPLIELILENVGPKTWMSHGGKGTIDYSPETMSLVVNQTTDMHEQITDTLGALRRLREQYVQAEVRFLSISPAFLDQLQKKDPASPVLPAAAGKAKSLNPKQMHCLVEALQGDRRTNIMQAPRLQIVNGEKGSLRVEDKQLFVTGVTVTLVDGKPVAVPKTEALSSGIEIGLLPVISADRRSVRVQFEATLKQVDTSAPLVPVTVPVPAEKGGEEGLPASPGKPVLFTQYLQQPRPSTTIIAKNFTLADGHTMLFSAGTRDRAVHCDDTILNHLPLIGCRYCVPGSRQTEHLFVLVTPKIIVRAEEEQRAPPKAAAVAPASATLRTCMSQEAVQSAVKELLHHFYVAYQEGKYQEAAMWAHLADQLAPHSPTCKAAAQLARARCESLDPARAPCPMPAVVRCVAEQPVDGPCSPAEGAKVASLIAQYHHACAAGCLPEAHLFAAKALAIDPTCFASKPATSVPHPCKRLIP